MELRDLLVTPIVFVFVLVIGYLLRQYFTDALNRRYFLPALALKMFGAVVLGLIYQFYYPGGDTFNYHTHGSRHIWNAFIDSPLAGFKLLLNDDTTDPELYRYASRILFLKDSSSFFVVRIAAVFDLFTASSYAATAILFSVFSFVGSWMLYITFYQKYPELHKPLAVACLFIPSVVLWGSGVLKDSIVLACLGMLTYETNRLFSERKLSFFHILVFLFAIYCIFSVKKFVLQVFLPSLLLWVFLDQLRKIKSVVVRLLSFPILVCLIVYGGYLSAAKVGEGDGRYALDKISKTVMITAYDIRYYTGKGAGSGYDLGELDGTIQSMLWLAPAAVNVTLFRPYLWEVANPLMMFSATESLLFAIGLLFIFLNGRWRIIKNLVKVDIAFCLMFALVFAFVVGVSTFNFGTLARYKILLLPFFAIAMVLLNHQSNNDRKLAVLDATQ
ncbi:MAG: hypothetical protein ACKOC0_05785, partial [Cytophagales bacterium]